MTAEAGAASRIAKFSTAPENPSCVAQNKKEKISFHIYRQRTSGWMGWEEMSAADAAVGEQEDWANMKNRYSLWTASRDTSALEIYALMPSPIPRQICWHGGVGVCCKGTIWRSSMQLESQCAFFISLASTLARECEILKCGMMVAMMMTVVVDSESSKRRCWMGMENFWLQLWFCNLHFHWLAITRTNPVSQHLMNSFLFFLLDFHTREASLERNDTGY